eukprot:s603_g2.t1
MQASALFCATIGIPQASTHLLFDVDDQVVVGIYNNLDAARAKFVHRQEKLITYGGWCDVEADEVDLGKGLLDDTGGQKKVTWVKLHDTKVDNLKLSDGKKLTVKSGTQIMDRCWRHLREHLRDTPRKPENLIVTGRIRSAALTSEKSREFIFMNVVGSAETWKPLPKTRCDVLKSQISLAMHFSHAALDQAGVHIMRRGEIMTKAADRWWSPGDVSCRTCHGLGTSLLTTTSTTTTRSTTNASSSVAQPSAAADWRFGAGGNATFHLLSSIATESDGACAVLNQLGKLRCFSELNCSSDVTCGRDELYLENIQNTTGCKPSWPALPNQTQIMGEARLFLQTSGRFMVFLRDPRDLVIASFRAAGAAKNQDCPGMALFAMRHIQPVSRWVNWRHRIVSQIREIDAGLGTADDSLAAVFFFEDSFNSAGRCHGLGDFVNNATSVVRSMARFMGVQVSASMLKSLSDVANSTNANSTNKGGGRRLCLSASVVPGHVGAAMTRLMQRELSTTLWDRASA